MPPPRVSPATVGREWLRIGLTGFGGPPAHIALLRELVVERRGWMDDQAFEDANAACQLLPGPASTQLALFCAQRLAGVRGLLLGGAGFVLPAVVLVLALSLVFLADDPPAWVRGAGAGAGGATVAVAVHAGLGLLRPGWRRAHGGRAAWLLYVLAGLVATIALGPLLVLALLGAGLAELLRRRGRTPGTGLLGVLPLPPAFLDGAVPGLVWTALKVGALSYGGGFVIIPLMRGDAVSVHGWMTDETFLNAVALGQVTPGPVVATVAAVGYAAGGVAAGLLAAAVAFAPSFLVVALTGERFERLRANPDARAFLDGAGPAAAGAILGSAVVLGAALPHAWQLALGAGAALALLVLHRGVVATLLASGAIGVAVALAGGPV